jgi:hypothetical protein
MSFVKQFEKRIDETLRTLFRSESRPAETRELIEIERSILDEIAERIAPAPRGRLFFPYNYVRLMIAVPEPERKAIFEAVFEPAALKQAILERLEAEQAYPPPDFHVSVDLVEVPSPEIGPKGYYLSVQNSEREPVVRLTAAPRSRFTVLHGSAHEGVWTFSKTRINIGRMNEVKDEHLRPVRRNDLVFEEAEGPPNSTVSRAHAHVQYDKGTGEFRIFDDQSAYGTGVFHEGQLTKVPAGAGRGLRLVSGDEIYFGQARVLFELVEE